ncbi:hypothetical protein D8674_030884 [Pyrus ussuriensis x Pyrus communis]|uniref:Uncharacterized protein n=1 Tax=Pyrus ussuriensis x Pyrus communis TaxID=2448454 RepID=A0A5N5FA74_9ROSA|nr:hypothetical protein D8674_030884 [Pyrus ussuriensis x Pyrus communis]
MQSLFAFIRLFIAFSSTFQELSKQNANNRKKLKYHHKGGTRPFIQHARTAHKKRDSLSMINNWGALHKDKNNSVHVPLDDEFGIMAENLRRKGKSINDVAVFPHTNTSGCISSMTSSSELIDMRSQIKFLSDGFLKLQQENEQLRAFIAASQEKTNNSIEFDGDISEGENTYPELEEHDLEEE